MSTVIKDQTAKNELTVGQWFEQHGVDPISRVDESVKDIIDKAYPLIEYMEISEFGNMLITVMSSAEPCHIYGQLNGSHLYLASFMVSLAMDPDNIDVIIKEDPVLEWLKYAIISAPERDDDDEEFNECSINVTNTLMDAAVIIASGRLCDKEFLDDLGFANKVSESSDHAMTKMMKDHVDVVRYLDEITILVDKVKELISTSDL